MNYLIISLTFFSFITNIQARIKSKDILANRFLVQNILIDIFSDQARIYTNKFIIPNISTFGGPCDLYEQVRKERNKVYSIESSCFGNKSNHKVSLNVDSSALRAGFMLKTCKSITSDDKVMRTFYKKYEISGPNDFSITSLKKLHRDFFPLESISDKQVTALKRLFYSSTANKWQSVALAYCISPRWHLL